MANPADADAMLWVQHACAEQKAAGIMQRAARRGTNHYAAMHLSCMSVSLKLRREPA